MCELLPLSKFKLQGSVTMSKYQFIPLVDAFSVCGRFYRSGDCF